VLPLARSKSARAASISGADADFGSVCAVDAEWRHPAPTQGGVP